MELKDKIKKWNQIHSKLYPFETKCFLTFLFLNQSCSSYFDNLWSYDMGLIPENYLTTAFDWEFTPQEDGFWAKLNLQWREYLIECRKKRKNKEKCLI